MQIQAVHLNTPLRGLTRLTAEQPAPQEQAPVDSVTTTAQKSTISPQSALKTATVTALRTAAALMPGASYLLAPSEDAYRGKLDIEGQVKDLKPYARERLGELPEAMSLGQVLAFTGARSLTEVVRHKSKFADKLHQLESLGKDFQGALLVGENDSLVVLVDPTVPEQTRVTSFDETARNEAARAKVLSLLENDQLQGTRLAEVAPELATPGSDVKAVLTQALSQVEGGYVQQHQQRAQALALDLAKAMDADAETVKTLEEVGSLFQIGKLGVPSEILDFEGKWPEDKRREWGMALGKMTDAGLAAPLLSAFGVSEEGRQAVFNHKQDYLVWNPATSAKDRPNPNWESVPLASRILRVADSVDSMLNNKRGNSRDGDRSAALPASVLEERLRGQVDPEVMAAYLKLAP